MTDAEKDVRIAKLEAALKRAWERNVAPYLDDPKYSARFIALDREIRDLGGVL